MNESPPSILIIGGYGAVGSHIAKTLVKQYGLSVTIAGRNKTKAEAFATKLGKLAQGVAFDSHQLDKNRDLLANYKLVINCVDQPDTKLIQELIKQDGAYIDITADYKFIRQARKLHSEAQSNGARILLGLGLIPGLANVMAKAASEQVGTGAKIITTTLLSLADQPGDMAMAYMIGASGERYEVPGERRVIRSFGESRISLFPAPLGPRRAYHFPLPGQFFYPETLGAETASTYLALEPNWSATMLAAVTKLGLAPLLKSAAVQRVILPLLNSLPTGNAQPVYAVLTEASAKGRQARYLVHGEEESATTALVAAIVSRAVVSGRLDKPGVWLPEQVIEPQWLFDELAIEGINVVQLNQTVTQPDHVLS